MDKEKYDEFWDGLDPEKVQREAEKRARVKENLGDFGLDIQGIDKITLGKLAIAAETEEPGIIEEGEWDWVLELITPQHWDDETRDAFFDDVADYVYGKYPEVFVMAHREPLIDDEPPAHDD